MKRWLGCCVVVSATLAIPTLALPMVAVAQEGRALHRDAPWEALRPAPPPTPTPRTPTARVAGLLELERSAVRFQRSAESYRATIDSLLRRGYLRERRGAERRWGSRLSAERRLEDQARRDAIVRFEEFLRLHPRDPEHAPDALLRLGELYYERAVEAYHGALDRGQDVLAPELAPTIGLYRGLVRRFPSHVAARTARALLAHYLADSGQREAAMAHWRELACPSVDAASYAACPPRGADARAREAWFRLGEQHFEGEDPTELTLAIDAYRRVLADPEDRNYGLALYKTAWAFYRDGRYPAAIQHFARLVDWADAEPARSPRPGAELRPEALQYLGLAFAWDDWDGDGEPDGEQRGSAFTGLARVRDARLLPQDRAWTARVWSRVGEVYFDEGRFAQAAEVLHATLNRWPQACNRHRLLARAVEAYDRAGAQDSSRSLLNQLSAADGFWQLRCSDPSEQREEAAAARTALLRVARRHHAEAQEQRRSCVAGNSRDCAGADRQYGMANNAYRAWLERYPGDAHSYAVRYDLAESLYWSGHYPAAAAEYAAVRDSPLDDARRADAGRRVVEAIRRQLERRASASAPTLPAPGSAPRPMGELELALGLARDVFLESMAGAADRERVADAYALNNALLLARHAHFEQAEGRLESLFARTCEEPARSSIASDAWRNLRHLALHRGDRDMVERLSSRAARCTFGAALRSGTGCSAMCTDPANADEPACLACDDRLALCVDRHSAAIAAATHRDARGVAADRLLTCADLAPAHALASMARLTAARALAEAGRSGAALRVYDSLVDGSPDPVVVAEALFRRGLAAMAVQDHGEAARSWRVLAQRFSDSEDAAIVGFREDGRENHAILLVRLEQRADAATLSAEVALRHPEAAVRAAAAFRTAELELARGAHRAAARAYQRFVRDYPAERERVVRAHLGIARAERARGRARAHRRALERVVNAAASAGSSPGSAAASAAAEARFLLAEQLRRSLAEHRLAGARARTLDEYGRRLVASIAAAQRDAEIIAEAYGAVISHGDASFTASALERRARVWERLADDVLEFDFHMPADLARSTRRLSPGQRQAIADQVRARIAESLAPHAERLECAAAADYLLALRTSRRALVAAEDGARARARLAAFGEERVGACIAELRSRDPGFAPLARGELDTRPAAGRGELTQHAPPTLEP